jgi:hypothetical protein
MEQMCGQWPPLVSHVEFLRLHHHSLEEKKQREVITLWLRFLRLFTAVRTLHLHGIGTVSPVAHTLGGLEGRRAAEVLPMPHRINFSCSELGVPEALRLLGSFVVAREESEHPVVVEGPRS